MMFVLASTDPRRLSKALEMNYRAKAVWECRQSGGTTGSLGGITWTRGADSTGIWFPRLTARDADSRLADFLRRERRRRIAADVKACLGSACTPKGLIGHLVAHGFDLPQGGGLPAMAMALTRIPRPRLPAGVEIRHRPVSSRVCRFEACLNDTAIGRVLVFCAAGVAGVFDLHVDSGHRLRGVGAGLLAAACRWARDRGYAVAVLTANPRAASLYARFRFCEVGRVTDCTATRSAVASRPLPPSKRALVVAAHMGRLDRLQTQTARDLRALVTPGSVDLMQVAASAAHRHVGEWLLAMGLRPDALSAWDLGWASRLAGMGRRLNQKARGRTPLHQAVLRRDTLVDRDLSLVKALLEAGADPSIRDDDFDATPLAWAKVFSDLEAERLLSA